MAVGLLGNTTNNVSSDRRRLRYRLQDTAARLLPGERVSWCMRKQAGETVKVKHNCEHAYYSGVAVCGSVWTCPICAAKITERRRVELQDAVNQKVFTKVMVTVTLQHERQDNLADLLDALNDSLRRLKQGSWWKRIQAKYGIKAHVSALEVTYGTQNGWHPHKHWLIFSDLPEQEFKADEFRQEVTERWCDLLDRHGRYASRDYGIDVRIGDTGAAGYVSKWGLEAELTKSPVKKAKEGGYSPFQLLELAADGETWAGALFVEYAKAVKGKRQLSWSHGARQVLGLGEEQPDEQLALDIEKPEDQILVELSRSQWGEVLRQGVRCALLEVADRRNPAELLEFLDLHGIRPG